MQKPNNKLYFINFTFNEVPDRVSKKLVHCLLRFTMDLFKNKAQFDTGFSKRLKLKDCAVLTILDLTVMSHHTGVSNCFNYMITVALYVFIDHLIWIFY